MNARPFPKPPPADPLPLDTWLRRTDRAEAGREPFFRGRDTEYEVYRSAVTSLSEGVVGGGTMIFQGAPGAGKSALMAECLEAVRQHSSPKDPWVAVAIKPETLQSPVDVVMRLVEAANTEMERLRRLESGSLTGKLDEFLERSRQLHQELAERGVGLGGISVGGRATVENRGETTWSSEQVFRNAAPLLAHLHLVVGVDEAQNIPVSESTRGVVDCLHSPPGDIPLVAAFFGLSDTQNVLRQCGLSRFADGRVANLEPLAEDEAANAIRSVLDIYGFAGMLPDRAEWVTRLAELSQGWPQHINRVAVAAAQVILDSGRHPEKSSLEKALALGRERKEAYYAGRLAAGARPPWAYRQMARVDQQKGGVLPLDDLRQFLAEESLEDFLTNALHAGLLAQVKQLPYHYRIPIPSFGDYLRALPVEPPSA